VDKILDNLWNPATFAKVAFLLVTAPFWWPLAKVMYHEILPALNAPGDAVRRNLAPHEDPFHNVPLASHRTRRAAANAPVTRASARPTRRT
jgi:hypothetical protein